MSLAECLDTLCQAVFFHPAKMVGKGAFQAGVENNIGLF